MDSWEYLKYQHSSVESGLSYWTMGMSDPFYTAMRSPINSSDYWIAFGEATLNTGTTLMGGTIVKQGAKAVTNSATKVVTKVSDNTLKSVDPNKLNHIFGKSEHKLGNFLKSHGGDQSKAYNAIQSAADKQIKAKTGVFEEVINVGGTKITVRGNVIDGKINIGTVFIP